MNGNRNSPGDGLSNKQRLPINGDSGSTKHSFSKLQTGNNPITIPVQFPSYEHLFDFVTTISHEGLRYPRDQDATTLRVSVLYDDESSGEMALHACEQAQQPIGCRPVSCFWCKTRWLSHPRFFGEAVKHAVGADVIIVAPGATRQTPPLVMDWVHQWIAHRPRSSHGIFILLHPTPQVLVDGDCDITRFFKSVCDNAGLRFMICSELAREPSRHRGQAKTRRSWV